MRRALLLLAAVALAGCSPKAAREGLGSPMPTRPPAEVSAWFLADRGGQIWLAQELRTVPDDARIPQAAVEQVLGGPRVKSLFTPFPDGTRVRSVTVDGSVATVDFDARVLAASVGTEAEAYGIQSIVYTLTDLPPIEKVRFTVEGRDSGTASNGRPIQDWWGHVGLSGQPFTRDPSLRIFDASGT
ncbi:MAG TPA: GerMN domain-containing protein [Actinomycetota bacterium]|jgi:spore germination protein GerM